MKRASVASYERGRRCSLSPCKSQADCSLIGTLKSSTSETDALAGVTVLFEVDSWSPHLGCQGRNAATCEAPFFPNKDNGQESARSHFNPPSQPGQRLRVAELRSG